MLTLCNGSVKLEFDEKNAVISSLQYGEKEYIGAPMPVFELAFRGRDTIQYILHADDFTLEKGEKTEKRIACVYRGQGTEVSLSVTLADGLNWNIAITGKEDAALEWVKYPQLAVPDDFADRGGSSKILWGFNEGTLIENMDDRERGIPYFEPEYPCQGIMGVFPAVVETQFMAYYNEISGLYIASHDALSSLKAINPHRHKGGGVLLEYRHFAGCDFGEDYRMPYEMVLRFFHGDWQDAAEIYREWFLSQNRKDFVKIGENKKLPAWYGQSPVVITYPVRGKHDTDVMTPNKLYPYTNVLPHVEKFEKAFDSKVMVLLMHWEGTAPWAPPVVWPPYGDAENFRQLIAELHRRGDVFGVYCSGLGWTLKSNLVEGYETQEYFDAHDLKEEMCLSPEQTLPYSAICTAQRVGYDMCPTRDFVKNILKEQVKQMVGAGIDYIQLMDQNHGGTSYFCYSRKHGHPPVPGAWQVRAVQALLSEINTLTGQTLLGCESAAAESYIPNLLFSDNRFHLAYYIGRPVPAYAYVYHEYVNNFLGNQVCVDYRIDYDRSPAAFYERLAYAFCAGDMLTAVMTEDGEIDWNWGKADKTRPVPNQENTQRLIKNLNFWRKRAPEYLHLGEMIKPIPVMGGSYVLWRTNGSKIELPAVATSAWRAQNGRVAQFLVNYQEAEKECRMDFGPSLYRLKTAEGEERLLTGEENLRLCPFSAVMLEKETD